MPLVRVWCIKTVLVQTTVKGLPFTGSTHQCSQVYKLSYVKARGSHCDKHVSRASAVLARKECTIPAKAWEPKRKHATAEQVCTSLPALQHLPGHHTDLDRESAWGKSRTCSPCILRWTEEGPGPHCSCIEAPCNPECSHRVASCQEELGCVRTYPSVPACGKQQI